MEQRNGALRQRLRKAGLRATRQRLELGSIIFDGGDRHLTAEQLHADARQRGIRVSLATVYNTLHQFTAVGLLREIVVDPRRSYFDTNTSNHHHFFDEDTGELVDIPAGQLDVSTLPEPPHGTRVQGVDVVIRVGRGA
ncbi:MAG: Fur family transcriptional regulator [Ectothiorhodospiraceae bacterium]|jgi:Fur family iron response transcriptional regulator